MKEKYSPQAEEEQLLFTLLKLFQNPNPLLNSLFVIQMFVIQNFCEKCI